MALTGAVAEAEQVLSIGLAQADANVSLRSKAGRAEAREVLAMLEEADRELGRRLEREARRFGPTERFTGAGLLAYRRQVQLTMAFVRGRLNGLSRRSVRRNIRRGWFDTVGLLGRLETAYSGSVRPLRINSARMMNERTRGVRASLLRQHATSMDRYGEELEQAMRKALRTNLLSGGTFSQAVDQLVRGRGPRGWVSMVARDLGGGRVERIRLERIPRGLFRRYRYWAMRIVRTETAYAQNAAGHEAISAARDEDFPDMQKKILAMMDNRTYPDSIAVHGQIRDVGALFRDGAGREYLHPPARPNDREVVIPWRPGWEETETSSPRPNLEEAIERATAARGTQTLPEAQVAALVEAQTPAELAANAARIRREERATRMRGLGYDPQIVARDANEIGTERTPEGIREQARSMAEASRPMRRMPTTESGVRRQITLPMGKNLRGGVRRLIRTMTPDFMSRDVATGSDSSRNLRDRLSLVRIIDEEDIVASHSRVNGSIRMTRQTSAGAAEALHALSRGRDPGAEGWTHLGSLIHEEHHGASRITGYYRGMASALEEAGIESRARHVVGRIAETVGSDAPERARLPNVIRRGDRYRPDAEMPFEVPEQPYQDLVEGLHVAVGRQRGITGEELNSYVQDRLGEWFGPAEASTLYQTEGEYVSAFAAMMDPDDPQQMERLLREHLEDEW
jgi:hypothetical protein